MALFPAHHPYKKIDQTDAPPLLYRILIYTKKEKEAIPPSRGHYTMQEQMREQCPLATRGDPLLTTPLKLKQRHLTSTMRGMVLNPDKAISPDFNRFDTRKSQLLDIRN